MEHLPYFGFLATSPWLFGILSALGVLLVGYFGSPLIIWALFVLGLMFGWGAGLTAMVVVAALFTLFLVVPLRRNLISRGVMKAMAPIMPKISETERTALDAGVVWVEKDLFSGNPDIAKLLNEPYPQLTAEEKAFMDGPVEKLCTMIDSWQVWKTRELEAHIWDYIKKEKFLGMIIPKEYGGLGFTALAQSQVVMKLASRSIPACISVMVPNSLGPAELLIHYGTDAQKKKYLPPLAIGQEMPCFALTEPGAGSDAGAIVADGELFKGDDGALYVKLNWNKRWITLASISTVLGLAFKLRDPKNLLGKGTDLGITCALIPSNTPGVVIGRRHDPLGVPFHNCPTQGKDVVLKAEEVVIGGLSMAGKGWSMLMDCLAAGRGISLPAQATGGTKLAAMITSAHSSVRTQFGVSIGQFEGIEEPLSRITGYAYLIEAMRRYTVGALDQGIKPPVITAMVKYYSTEIGRKVINDAMDIVGGAAISMGPRNALAEIYIATPIGITVEGANILTRTLIVFGQGALRAHPYAYREVKSIEEGNLVEFDSAFWGHIGHIVRNSCRSVVLSLTRGYFASGGDVDPELKMYVRCLKWASATFSILADLAMGTLGGSLKFREKITGRFADILAWMYMATAVIRRFEAEGRRPEDLAFVKWSLKLAFAEIQKSFDGIFDNMYGVPQKGIAKILFGTLHLLFKQVLGAWSRINSIGSQATDHLQHVMCSKILAGGELRDRLIEGIYIPTANGEQVAHMEKAMKLVNQSQAIEKKIYKARRDGTLPRAKGEALVAAALEKGVITASEKDTLAATIQARWDAIQVDDFDEKQYRSYSAEQKRIEHRI